MVVHVGDVAGVEDLGERLAIGLEAGGRDDDLVGPVLWMGMMGGRGG
jgi:hypothetical protein